MTILFPSDPASVLVMAVLFGVVAYWHLKLRTAWRRIQRERTVIDHLTEPEAIAQMKTFRKNVAMEGPTGDFAERAAEELSVQSSSVVFQHVRSILEAGVEGTRLEVGERLSSTTNRIFRDNARLKAVLSVFIVIGLLGTLYGLAEALATLSAKSLLAFKPSVLQTLLGRLKTALAPSIWGVFLTVSGVLLYGYYLNSVCQPVKSQLEQATLEHWVPALYPTKSQQTKETLEEARSQLRENVEAAERVAHFAERVDDDLQDFDARIASAKEFLQTFGASLEELSQTADSFQRAMADLEDFQEQLVSMYRQIEKRQQALHDLLDKMEERDERFQDRLGDLDRLQQAWRDHLSQTQQELQTLSRTAQTAFESLDRRNDAVIEALREPIIGELESVSEELARLDESTHQGLREVEQGLRRLEDPLAGSAERIQRIADTFTESLRNTVTGVRDEFERQNNEQAERRKELTRLNDNLEALIKEQKAMRETIREYGPSSNGSGWIGRVRSYFGE